jgi:ABC-type branched-subunit amino acid transport system substrate-binding protein
MSGEHDSQTTESALGGQDPAAAGLFPRGLTSRREFLKSAGIAGAAVGVGGSLSGFLSACGGTSETNTIRILGTMPLSGDAANIGPPYDKAVRLAIDEMNAAGVSGFAGIDYELDDTETKPSVLTQKLQRAEASYDPDMEIGCALETEISVPCVLAPKFKLPVIVGGHLGMSKYQPPGEVPLTNWVCYYGYADYFCGYLAGQFFAKNGAKKVAYVAGDYDWGYSNGIGLRSFWEDNGKPFEISPVIYTPLDKTDFSTESQSIKAEEPDALYCVYMGAGWFSFPKQLRDADAVPKYFLYDPTYSNLGGAIVTGAYGAEGIYTLADHDPDSRAWADFVKRWKRKYGHNAYPEAYTNNHYQATYWFVEACKKAGQKGVADHDTLIDTMHRTSFQNVCISPMGPLDPYGGNVGATAAIIQFQKGAGPLQPSFPLHDVLIEKTPTPEKTTKEVLDIMKGISRL